MSLPITMSNDFYLEVVRGNVAGYTAKELLGLNAAVGGTEDVWNQGGAITQVATAALLYISSSAALDITQSVIITGLDTNYDEITETIALNGADGRTRVAGTKLFLRVNNVALSAACTGKVYIYYFSAITAGVPDDLTKVQAAVDIAETRSYSAIYTVPRNKNWYLTSLSYRSAGALATFDVVINVTRKVYNIVEVVAMDTIRYTNPAVATTFVEDKVQYVDQPIFFPAKSEVRITAGLAGGTALNIAIVGCFIEEDIVVEASTVPVMDKTAYLTFLTDTGGALVSQNYWLIGFDPEPSGIPSAINLSDVLTTITGATNYTVAADTEVAFDPAYFSSGKLVITTKKAIITVMRCVDSNAAVRYVFAPVNTYVDLGNVKKISYLHN